jgi:hypothetical protein
MGYPVKMVGTLPRDAMPHSIGGSWELNKKKEMPYFCRVWADGRFGGDFEVLVDAPTNKLRYLDSITFYQSLTVLPRRDH